MIGKCEYEYLFSEGLAVVPRAAEDNIAILVNGVTYGDKTKHIQWPL